MEAAGRGIEYIETHPDQRFCFQVTEVLGSVQPCIFSFQAANQPARELFASMREIMPYQPGTAGESWRQAFNTLVDHAKERDFVREDTEKRILTLTASPTIPVMRPLLFKGK